MSFDCNVDNYNIEEIESIFELTKVYSEVDIATSEHKLRHKLLNDQTITSDVRVNMIRFIEQSKSRLDSHLKGKMMQPIATKNTAKNTAKAIETIEAGDTFITRHPDTPFINSQPSDYYAGSINPLNKRIMTRYINIDTRFRNNYYDTDATDFHIDLPIKLTKVVSLSLCSIELSMSNIIYNISSLEKNNYFWISILHPDDTLCIVIPDGNYSIASLQTYINNCLHNATNSSFHNISIYIDDACSGKTCFYTTQLNFIFSLHFDWDEYGNTKGQGQGQEQSSSLQLQKGLGWMLGYRLGVYTISNNMNPIEESYSNPNNADTFFHYCSKTNNNISISIPGINSSNPITCIHISEGLCNISISNYIYLAIDDYNNNIVSNAFISAFATSTLNKNIIARIQTQNNANNNTNTISNTNINKFNLCTNTREYFGPVDIQKMNIQLLDEYGRVVNINQMDYSFCLEFQSVYDL